jgi:hypothetical protein
LLANLRMSRATESPLQGAKQGQATIPKAQPHAGADTKLNDAELGRSRWGAIGASEWILWIRKKVIAVLATSRTLESLRLAIKGDTAR